MTIHRSNPRLQKARTIKAMTKAMADPLLAFVPVSCIKEAYRLSFPLAKKAKTLKIEQAGGINLVNKALHLDSLLTTLRTLEVEYPGVLSQVSISGNLSKIAKRYKVTRAYVCKISRILGECASLTDDTRAGVAGKAASNALPLTHVQKFRAIHRLDE